MHDGGDDVVFINDFMRRTTIIADNAGARLAEAGALAANELQGIAKRTAPWEDITGAARREIVGSSSVRGNVLTIRLAGLTFYSIFLELANERNWAALLPALRAWGPSAVRLIGRRMNGG